VCFVAPTTWPILSGDPAIRVVGGAEVQQSMIAPALARRGYRVSMICLDYGQEDVSHVDGISVYKVYRPDEGLPVLRFVHPRITTMWQALKRVNADVYYQRTAAVQTTITALFCRHHGKRSIYSAASDMDFVPGREEIRLGRDRWIFRYGLRRVDRVIVQNALQYENCLKNYGRTATLIPSCYEPPAGAHADRKGYVLWVARMGASKRPELIVEIAKRLPHLRFVVVGGADKGADGRGVFEAMQRAAKDVPNVELKGFVPYAQVDQYFNGARVQLNTSKFEGFPNTFLQGWSRGIPTVCFIDTGSREEGEPVCTIVSSVDEAAAQVARLMSDDVAWQRASNRCLAHFRRQHSIDAMLVRYEHILTDLGGMAR